MVTGWRYRVAALLGVVVLTPVAVFVGNDPAVQRLLQHAPLYGHLWLRTIPPDRLVVGLGLVLGVMAVSMLPLYKPQPRRILDVVSLTGKRAILATVLLAAVGYFDWTYRLPRPVLVGSTLVLLVALPAWFLVIRQRVREADHRVLIVGDDTDAIDAILAALERPVIGYVAPSSAYADEAQAAAERRPLQYADGGQPVVGRPLDDLPCLGGLSKLEDVLIRHDVDTVALAFEALDRHVFFGVLELCHRNGVTAKAHREHADRLLTNGGMGDLADLDLTPLDWQDRLLKRAFDVVFAAAVLAVLAPVLLVAAVAVKLDSPGPLLYAQERTATFGETFNVYKFRTMVPGSEDPTPIDDAVNDRISRVGRVLRPTHLDELPQFWAVLRGTMSVVGPRPAWTDEETLIEATTDRWRKRWFVKPGLTGLAQINEVASTEPERKLEYDVEYIRRQSFWFDVQIVTRQVWMVLTDVGRLLRRSGSSGG